jgi:phosphoenolpyruvate carboxylase
VGTGLETWVKADKNGTPESERLERLHVMYETWPFFRSILDNVQAGLSKADMAIAAHYAGLTDARTREAVFADILDEHALTERMVLNVTGQTELLENESWLQRSIKLRNPYVDPMNYIQVALLEELRTEPETENAPLLRDAMLLSVNGVAAGLQNTG